MTAPAGIKNLDPAAGGRASARAVHTCPDCGRTIRTNGFFTHKPKGEPCRDVQPHADALPRFLDFVEKTVGCWLWRGFVHKRNGYGYFNFRGARPVLAHRFSFEAHVGPIPEGKVIDHLCRVRHCVNPTHLELVTQSVNLSRGYAARRAEAL